MAIITVLQPAPIKAAMPSHVQRWRRESKVSPATTSAT
jgi:hypothetical protein